MLIQESAALKAMAAMLLGYAQKNDPVPNSDQGSPYAHGPGGPGALSGVFSALGVDPRMFATVPQAATPAAILLRRGGNPLSDPIYETVTGITQANGSFTGGDCGPYPVSGNIKVCSQTAPFGKLKLQTPTRDLAMIGKRVNRGEIDRTLVNNFASANPLAPAMLGGGNINDQAYLDFLQIGLGFDLLLARMIFQGDRTTGIGGSSFVSEGAYLDFDGLDALIRTGVVDALTGVACPAMDSIVEDYASQEVGADGSTDIVRLLAGIFYSLQRRAELFRMSPATWAIFMHADLFHRLTELWPCSYLTNQCTVADTTTGRVNVGGAEQVAMRDDMRNNKFLWVQGQRVPVVISDGMANAAYGPGFRSSIYIVNLMALGQQTSYLEYFDMANAELSRYLNAIGGVQDVGTVNGGMYLVTQERQGKCLQYKFDTEMRLLTHTPYLNARIDNVAYSLLSYSRSPFHGDEYYKNGGQQFRPAPSLTWASGETVLQF